ncbi:unnamed protein product [Clonostachys rosea f. rosea IK726]|uniref:Uncharacterized protein n=2 Tax=Bionectria ochroleuca TaxID=29856 RepID=A0A0B7JJT4_BIOOC|nr:unnamed protein product [Clonostachys rosea f. rosea IK726]
MSWQELPVELRTDILSQLIHSDLFRPPPPYESCLSLRLVCRDFNSLFCSILYLGSNRLKDVPAKAKNGATVAWLLSLKAKMDPPGHDKTSTYFQEWASFMAAQSTLQPGGSGNYNQWLDAACRAAAYNGDPQAVCAWLVCSADSVVESVDLAPPRSLAAEQASAKPGNLSYLKNAHGALQIACENGNLEVVKSLLSSGIGPGVYHTVFGYPVHNAIRNDYLEIVRSLFHYGADRDPWTSPYATLLELAACHGSSAALKYLLGESPAQSAGSLQYLLFLACRRGHDGVVEALFQWIDEKNKPHKRTKSWVNRVMHRRAITKILLDPDAPIPYDKVMDLKPELQGEGTRTPLCSAVKNKHPTIVKFLIGRPEFHPGDQDNDSCPLFVAAQTDQADLTELLLDRYQQDDKVTSTKLLMLLDEACRFGSTSVVKLLLERQGVNPNANARTRSVVTTPLVTTVGQTSGDSSPNHVSIVKLLLQHHLIDPQLPRIGLKPLEIAIDRNNTAMVELLLNHRKTDPNLYSDDHYPPLCKAIRNGNSKIVRLLLKRPDTNPNLRGKDRFWGTPLVTAVGRADTLIVRELLERSDIDPNMPSFRHKPSGNPLYYAAGSGNHEIIKLLLRRVDIDVNVATDNNTTPLVHAIMNKKIGIVKFLLAHQNIDPNYAPEAEVHIGLHGRGDNRSTYAFNTLYTAPTRSGVKQIPLFVAGAESNRAVFGLLLRHPLIDIHATDSTGRTPLWWAAAGGPEISTHLLLERGAGIHINKQDIQGWAPLHVAANRQRIEVIEYLLSHPDINPNLANQNGCTALHIAVFGNDVQAVGELLAHPKTDRNLETNDGQTALSIARSLEYHRLTQLLEANEE